MSSLNGLIVDLQKAPYAFLQQEDVDTMVKNLTKGKYEPVIELLNQDAEVHATCDNYIKSEVIGKLAKRVQKLLRSTANA